VTGNRPDLDAPTAFASFEPVLSRWTTEELNDAADTVASLVEHPGYRVLHRAIKERVEYLFAKLVHGKLQEHAQMGKDIGMVSGSDQVLHVAQCVQYMAERRNREEAAKARQAEAAERREAAA
jgi:hypothetical protein